MGLVEDLLVRSGIMRVIPQMKAIGVPTSNAEKVIK